MPLHLIPSQLQRLDQRREERQHLSPMAQQREQSVHASNVVKIPAKGVSEKTSAIILAWTATNRIVREEAQYTQSFHVVVVLGVCRVEGQSKLNRRHFLLYAKLNV
jgi:hypothetical protein